MYEVTTLTVEDIKHALIKLLYNKLLIVFVTAAGLFAGLLYSANHSADLEYDATATVSVAYGQSFGPFTGAAVLTNYAEIVTSFRVSEYASKLLEGEGLTVEDIREMVNVTETGTSFVLKISARSDSPRTAILVANAVAESFVTQITQITGSTTISVLDYSRTAEIVYLDRSNIIIILAPAAAFIAVCAVLVLLRLISGKIWSLKQCVTDDRELLAVIPKVKIAKPKREPKWRQSKKEMLAEENGQSSDSDTLSENTDVSGAEKEQELSDSEALPENTDVGGADEEQEPSDSEALPENTDVSEADEEPESSDSEMLPEDTDGNEWYS